MRSNLLLTSRLLLPLLGLRLAASAQAPVPASAPNHTGKPVTALVAPTPATASATGDSLTGPASDQYRRGTVGRFFYGTHYRPTWEMPVTVPAFRPEKLYGGLKLLKGGDPKTTTHVRMDASDGHQYVLRMVEQDLSRQLPENQRKGLKARLLRDQASATFPYGALVVAELAQAAAVYHATPKLFRVPSNENVLGDYQGVFAGKLVYLEESPVGDWQGQRAFGGSKEVVNSTTMLAQRYGAIEASIRPPRLDMNGPGPARAYLRARLLDIFIADWARREDQWRWARFDVPAAENEVVRYRAIPRDRDHAFSRSNDGFFPGVSGIFKKKTASFGPKIGSIGRYLESEESLDHVLLGWVSLADFKAEADSLRRRLSDAALDRALTRMPANVQRLDGRRFRQDLQQRREALPAIALEFYAALNHEVLLPGTDGPDEYTIAPGPNGSITITWISRTDTTGRGGSSTYSRTFTPAETRRIQLHALGGVDKLTLSGPLPKTAPIVEFFDGSGNDDAKRTTQSETPSWFFIRASGDRNRFDAFPEWARKPDADTPARDFDAAGFLLRHRL